MLINVNWFSNGLIDGTCLASCQRVVTRRALDNQIEAEFGAGSCSQQLNPFNYQDKQLIEGASGQTGEISCDQMSSVGKRQETGACVGSGQPTIDHGGGERGANAHKQQQPTILITESATHSSRQTSNSEPDSALQAQSNVKRDSSKKVDSETRDDQEEGQFEVVDGIRYKLVAAVTKPPPKSKKKRQIVGSSGRHSFRHNYRPNEAILERDDENSSLHQDLKSHQLMEGSKSGHSSMGSRFNTMRRKSTALMTNLINSSLASSQSDAEQNAFKPPRRLSIYEMTKSPPPETSLEIYLNERRRSSNVSAQQVHQTQEQKSTFQVNYNQRQQYFKDLNAKLINQDKKLLNVVANRGQIHRHSVDIAQLPLSLALAKARGGFQQAAQAQAQAAAETTSRRHQERPSIDQASSQLLQIEPQSRKRRSSRSRLFSRRSISVFSQQHSHRSHSKKLKEPRKIIRKFRKLDVSELTASPAPDVKIGQRVAYKEYYGNEFGTIRWIGRVPQISPDWTVGVEFDNAIGEGDGSLSGRRYFIAKECFAKFLALDSIALVDQHVGRPEPGTMISVMSAASRPGQLISIQRVSTVHVQHCFLNAPHRRPGPEIPLLAVNTRLHCQCPNCGPCAHVIKPPRTQRLARPTKNATHMCQFSTYTCCGMQSQEDTLCNYQGNKVTNGPVPTSMHTTDQQHASTQLASAPFPPLGASWMAGSGYVSSLQAQQMKSMPQEFKRAPPSDKHNNHSAAKSLLAQNNYLESQQNPISLISDTREQESPSICELQHLTSESNYEASSCLVEDATNKLNLQLSSFTLNAQNDSSFACNNSNCDWPTRLKPEDESIDSTLEADLERLSQARYGKSRFKTRQLKCPAEAGKSNLLKTLKSLLSCLSIDANRVNLDAFSSQNSHQNSFLSDVHNSHCWRYLNKLDHAATLSQSDCQDEAQSAIYVDGLWSPEQQLIASRQLAASETLFQHQQKANLANDQLNEPLSGSSDCGFSSASQNSSPIKEMGETKKASSASMETNERDLANRIYLNIAGKLIKSGVSAEALEKLATILDQGQDSGQFDGPNQLIADIIANLLTLLPNNHQAKPIDCEPDEQIASLY